MVASPHCGQATGCSAAPPKQCFASTDFGADLINHSRANNRRSGCGGWEIVSNKRAKIASRDLTKMMSVLVHQKLTDFAVIPTDSFLAMSNSLINAPSTTANSPA